MDKPRVFYKEFVKKIFVKLADAYWCYGTASKNYLLKLGAKKGKISVNCQATENLMIERVFKEFQKRKKEVIKEMGLKDKNFIYVGRLSPEKNLLVLLKTFKKIKTEFPKSTDWGLIIVGDGPQRLEIEKFIEENRLFDVQLVGGKFWKEVPKFYALGDVFVLPSISETWGLVVNEAMICGLPVIVSQKAGVYWDLVKDGINGFGFNPFNENELKNIMLKFINEEVDIKVMGEASQKIIRQYTPENAARQMLKAIEYIFEEKR